MVGEYYVFAPQRSGTNYFEELMRANFGAKFLNNHSLCWKHSIEPPSHYDIDKAPTFVLHKNPYLWVESLVYRNCADWKGTQTTYNEVHKQEYLLGPERIDLTNACKTYKHFYRTWFVEHEKRMVVPYEVLLREETRSKLLWTIKERFGYKEIIRTWHNPRHGSIAQSKDYDVKREAYYLLGIPEKLTAFHIETINNEVGVDLIRKMGYTPIK